MSKVSKNRKVELDALLLKELDEFFQITSPSVDRLKHFLITTKDSTKYFDPTTYEVYYRKETPIKTFDEHIQLDDIHSVVRQNVDMNKLVKSLDKRETVQLS